MSWPILTVGPRNLPANGLVRVWIDIGSGPGYMREVRCDQLALAEEDDGEGDSAVYRLCPAVAPAGWRGRPAPPPPP